MNLVFFPLSLRLPEKARYDIINVSEESTVEQLPLCLLYFLFVTDKTLSTQVYNNCKQILL